MKINLVYNYLGFHGYFVVVIIPLVLNFLILGKVSFCCCRYSINCCISFHGPM